MKETDLTGIVAEHIDAINAREEVAKAAAFLAADGDYITGQQLNVNGGLYM